MTLVAGDLATYPSAGVPVDDSSTSGGAIDTGGGEISELIVGDFIPSEAPPTGGDVTWYYKLFVKNESGAGDNLEGPPSMWILNGLLLSVASGIAQIVSDEASETSGKVRLYGYSSGVASTEDINLNGTSPVNGSTSWDIGSPIRAQRLTAGGALMNAQGNITITRGISLGFIPASVNCATSEFTIGTDTAKDASTSSANRLTAPTGPSFTRAVDAATAINLPSSANLDNKKTIKI